MDTETKINKIPSYSLYGEDAEFPDILHCERITDRAHKHDWHFAPHRHLNLHQIFLVTAGQASMTFDGTSHLITANSVAIVPPPCVHGFVFEKRTKGFVLSIPSVEIATLSSWEIQVCNIFNTPQIIPATKNIIKTMKMIHKEHHNVAYARFALLRSLSLQLACHLCASASHSRQKVNPIRGKVASFEKLARDNFTKGWKIGDYAAALGISATHLNRLCQEILGQSPKDFVHMLVVQEAKRLLAYTKMDVASIGYRIGFEDPSYFSRMFMRQTGQSPRAFRNLYDENP